MLHKQELTLAISLLFTLNGTAQQRDSVLETQTKEVDEIVVTGTRGETDARHLSQTVSVISRQTIEQSMQPSLLPTLAEHVPGLFATSRGVMGYGVSGGAAGNISLRGLGSSSGRMLVLIDGQPQYMGLMGHPISDAYQSSMAERVEVLRGPASTIYGSNAMGGVVNIVTRGLPHDGVSTSLHAGYGSYNTIEAELSNQVNKGHFSSVVAGSYGHTDGHSSDMAFDKFDGYAKVGYRLSRAWSISANFEMTHFNASQSGSVSSPLADADQEVTRGMASVAVRNKHERTSGSMSVFYNWGNHWINDGYSLSGQGKPKAYRYDSHDDMAGVSLYQTMQLFRGNRLTVGADWFVFGGTAYNRYVEGERAGESDPLVDKTVNELAGYVDFRQDITAWLTFNAGLRADRHSEVGTEWIPEAGLSLRLPHSSTLKLSASKGFRYPTLREMYMFTPHNPELEPESMWNYELAFSQQRLGGRLRYGLNLFYIDGKNLIATVRNGGATPLNVNTGRIYNSGVEAQAQYNINETWAVEANYSLLHMTNPVVAAPENKLYAGANFTRGRWMVSSGIEYVAGLYTSVSPVTKESFVLWNVRAAFSLSPQFGLWVRGENLLAQKYEINLGYPMPRATVFGGINVRI
jgi:vitamin B12 transporter